MSHVLKEIPEIERPRERLEFMGASALSVSELLAIIIRCGTKNTSALSLAYEVLKEFETLDNLSSATISELSSIKGIQKAKAISIIASLELGKRLANEMKERKKINNIIDAYKLIKDNMVNLKNEELSVIYLNVKSEVIAIKKISMGTISETAINPKEIFKWALKYSSIHLIIVHNHPSGDPSPSPNDKKSTFELIKQAQIIGLKIIDHIIIGKNSFYSFQSNKIIRC